MGRKKLPDDARRTERIHIRVPPPFKAWLAGYVAHRRETLTEIVVKLLRDAAAQEGFEPPPKG
jgi:hypothetical protein